MADAGAHIHGNSERPITMQRPWVGADTMCGCECVCVCLRGCVCLCERVKAAGEEAQR